MHERRDRPAGAGAERRRERVRRVRRAGVRGIEQDRALAATGQPRGELGPHSRGVVDDHDHAVARQACALGDRGSARGVQHVPADAPIARCRFKRAADLDVPVARARHGFERLDHRAQRAARGDLLDVDFGVGERELVEHRAGDLDPLDRVDPEVGLHVGVEVEHLRRVAGALAHDLEQLGLDVGRRDAVARGGRRIGRWWRWRRGRGAHARRGGRRDRGGREQRRVGRLAGRSEVREHDRALGLEEPLHHLLVGRHHVSGARAGRTPSRRFRRRARAHAAGKRGVSVRAH